MKVLLVLYVSVVMCSFDGKKKRATGSAADQKRLVHKYRREMKGAVREIRRDNDFLARHRLGEQMKL